VNTGPSSNGRDDRGVLPAPEFRRPSPAQRDDIQVKGQRSKVKRKVKRGL
jgi:hypothetical protein